MAGVVRRDGLREIVRNELLPAWDVFAEADEDAEADACDELGRVIGALRHEVARVLDAVPDVPPTVWSKVDPIAGGNTDVWRCEEELCGALVREAGRDAHRLAFHMPDVPPDPPAADREALVGLLESVEIAAGGATLRGRPARTLADAILSSGVLVDDADVRARHAEQLARDILREGGEDFRYAATWLRDRAVSERERRTT